MMRTYEAMFLVDPALSTKDGKMPEHIRNILDKCKVKILKETKWADRNMAYKIKGHRRGTYYLSYFETEPENISKIRRECDLSTSLIRALILSIEPSMKEKALSSVKAAAESRDGKETAAPAGARSPQRVAPKESPSETVTAETKK